MAVQAARNLAGAPDGTPLVIARPCDGLDVGSAIARPARDELEAFWQLCPVVVVRAIYSHGGPGAILILEAGS
jgi:hypothetical protein